MKNSEYWKVRFEQLERAQHQKGVECYAGIEEQYRRAQRQIESQIAVWYQRFADNNGVSLQGARRMLNKRELAELKWDVNQYIKYGQENAVSQQWVKQLENASARYHISRLEALKLQTQQSLEVMFGNQLDSIDSTMRDVYKTGYYKTAFEIQKGVGVGWDFATLDEKGISKVINKPWAVDGKNFSERVWGNRQKLVNELNTELTRNVILGQGYGKAIDNIARKMNTSKNVTKRLVLTEGAFFNSAARQDCFKALDVEEYEIRVSYDEKTCDICQEREVKHFATSQWEPGVTAPPFHVNCRCDQIPYFDDEFSVMGTKAARDENGKTVFIPANMTYDEWKKVFVEGDKTGLQEVKMTMEKSRDMGYNVRNEKEFESVAKGIKSEITKYASNPSKWSGKINVNNDLARKNVIGEKEWTCDISVVDTADDGTVWHEMLHACSASYYTPDIYKHHRFIEEASVEFLKRQICQENEIAHVHAYENLVLVLQAINGKFHYGSDMEFARELFNVPLPDRYEWLEDKVVNSLKSENVSFEDFNEVLLFIRILKGGEDGKIT